MSYTDLAILIVMLVAILIGIERGFLKSIAASLGGVLCVIVAITLTTLTLDGILGLPGIKGLFYGESGSLAAAIKGGIFKNPSPELARLNVSEAAANPQKLATALGGGVFRLLSSPIMALINALNGTHKYDNALVTDCISVLFARYIGWAILCVIYFIILRIVAHYIAKLGDHAHTKPIQNGVDRGLGAALGAVKGFVFCLVALFVLGCFGGFGFMRSYFDDLNKSFLAGPLTNFATDIITKHINISSITGGLLKPA